MSDRRQLIEECISYTSSGRFEVRTRLNTIYKSGLFDTLTDARRFRDELKAMRQEREHKRGSPDYSTEDTLTRTSVREQLKKAPRTKVERDGRKFTLVSLPDSQSYD